MLNHEYIDAPLLHTNGLTVVDGKRTVADEVRKEINAHGVSVVGDPSQRAWRVECRTVATQSADHRRHADAYRRPGARGHELLRTRHSPDGTRTRGTHNNCSNGFHPWGTYLTCEENWVGYFSPRTANCRAN